MEFISHHEEERRLRGDGVRAMVVSEFYVGYQIRPRGGVISAEDPKVCFNFLVDPFCFSVGLGMIGGRQGEIVV